MVEAPAVAAFVFLLSAYGVAPADMIFDNSLIKYNVAVHRRLKVWPVDMNVWKICLTMESNL